MAAVAPGITYELKAIRSTEERGPAVSLPFYQENKNLGWKSSSRFLLGSDWLEWCLKDF